MTTSLQRKREQAEAARLKALEDRKISEQEEFDRIQRKREEAEKRLRTKELARHAKEEASERTAEAERKDAIEALNVERKATKND